MDNKDKLRELFAALPDDRPPYGFLENVMERIRHEELLRLRHNRIMEILGYISGIAAMLIICISAFYFYDIPFDIPQINIPEWLYPNSWSFPKPELELIRSQSFRVSAYIGGIALFLLAIDSTIRHHIGNPKRGK
ncbi:MAG: hypothetical protein LBR84_03170 [Tannerella sp.]|jgi:hypothetical protein|nr:hypothetical protein [Tannerella sp.]